MSFVHLHAHTQYSIQDAVNKIDDYLERVKELGQPACAITDHGVMYGVVQFYKKAKELGIKPIIGCEFYLTDRDRRKKEDAKYGKYYHLILLAENQRGYKNLVKLCTKGFTEGFYRRPRIDYQLLEEYHEGLICLSACIAGELPKAVLRGDLEAAKNVIRRNLKIFGEGNYFLEIQNHGIREEQVVAQTLVSLSHEFHVPLVATNDVHYTREEDSKAREALLCIRANSGRTGEAPVLLEDKADPRRISYDGCGYYVKSEEEMRELFPNLEEAIENTGRIAERCNVEFTFHETKMPSFQVPDGYSAYEYLEKLCLEGLPKRYPGREEQMKQQMEYELQMIRKMGFVEYFLIVWDFIHWARNHQVPVGPGRGSVCGSCVAYLLEITDIDPVKYDLVFERFLNPERISMPDIDMDFCMNNRYRVVDYVKQRYGEDCVSQIITFGTFAARQSIKDVGKCMGLTVSERDALAKLVPQEPGMTLMKARETSIEFDEACRNYESVYSIARTIEGLPRQTGTHAAGIIICDRPVSDYIPLSVRDGVVQSQFNMVEVEELGLLKMDFLGLRTLSAIDEAEKNIIKKLGALPEMKENDPEVFQMISTGKSTGVFQLESQGMQDFMKELGPTCMDDLIAGISLYRPGPMDFIPDFIRGKHGEVHYKCKELIPILKNTYGCIVYQEQVMQIFRDLAGYSLGRADIVRRAMSKKKAAVLDAEREVFLYGDEKTGVPGCVKNGISEAIAKEIFEDMTDFAKYAFNKSHAAAYATVCYRTAWLLHYFPTEYFAALMTSVITDSEKVAEYAKGAKENGIVLKPVDINLSEVGFTPINEKEILFAIGGISGIGTEIARTFCRRRKGRYFSFREVLEDLKASGVSSKGVTALANAGAFDSLGGTRLQYANIAQSAIASIAKEQKKQVGGQIDMFSLLDWKEPDIELPDIGDYTSLEKCRLEKEACGFYVSGSPLDCYRTFCHELRKKDQTLHAGVLKSLKKYQSKNGTMAFITMEQQEGDKEYVVFPNVFSENAYKFETDQILVFQCGRDNVIDKIENIFQFHVNVYVRSTEENFYNDGKTARALARDRKDSMGMDELRIYYADGQKICEIIRAADTGYYKEEDFLNRLRRQFGEDKVFLRIVRKF